MKNDAYDYIPASVAPNIPKLYATENVKDPTVWLRWFTPDSNFTFWVTEFDPDEKLCFGLVQGFETELGYFSLAELEEARGPLGLRLERDIHFNPKPLSKVRDGLAERSSP